MYAKLQSLVYATTASLYITTHLQRSSLATAIAPASCRQGLDDPVNFLRNEVTRQSEQHQTAGYAEKPIEVRDVLSRHETLSIEIS